MMNTGWRLRRRGSFLLALVVGLVVLADWLFYGQPIGWTASVFGLALLLAVTLRSATLFPAILPGGRGWPGRIVAGATLGLIAALVIHPSGLAVTLGLLGLVTLAAIDRGGWTSSVVSWAMRWIVFLGKASTQAVRDVVLQNRWLRTHRGGTISLIESGSAAGLGSVRAWVMPVGLSVVFVGLFAAANPVVQRGIRRAWDAAATRIAGLGEWLSLGRMGLWVVVAMAVWGLLRVRLRTPRPRNLKPAVGSGLVVHLDRVTGTSLVVRCLVLFNAVFAVQTLLDARYLYGGAVLPDGMTYAEYAQRGAYPLVATALLAGLFVLLTFRPGGAAQRSRWCRRLVGLWVAQNIVLMASAAWRLSLYVEVYSLTRWRVAAAVWMLLVAIGFGWLIWRIVAGRDNGWLLQRVTLTAVVVLYAVCFVDVDRRIAEFNVTHCSEVGGEGQPIDLAYLEKLGPAALPATQRLVAAWQSDPSPVAAEPKVAVWSGQRTPTTYRLEEARTLAIRLDRDLQHDLAGWRGWTLRRAQWAQPTLAVMP